MPLNAISVYKKQQMNLVLVREIVLYAASISGQIILINITFLNSATEHA